MARWWTEHELQIDVMVPVPLHPQRLRERGYNQAALLAHQLGRRVGASVDESILVRTRATRSQMSLDAAARRQNVHNAFHCPNGRARGQRVLLIDDVCTTGTTLEACADGLRAAGAASVQALTLARAP